MPTPTRVLLVLPSLNRGGAEKTILQVALWLQDTQKVEVHLAVLTGGGPLETSIPKGIEKHVLTANNRHGFKLAITALPKLVKLILKLRPHSILSTLTGTNILTILAGRGVHTSANLVLREASTLLNTPSKWKRAAMSALYRKADTVIAVSNGVAEDLQLLGACPKHGSVETISNAVDTKRLQKLSRMGPELHWEQFGHIRIRTQGANPRTSRKPPYIISIGRLAVPKDFPTLIRAYATSHISETHKLVIVGDGTQRASLEQFARLLGMRDKVVFTGAVDNPYRLLAQSSLYVLSSQWEGCPNTLLEALALDVPVISTRCPHGPEELLAGGRYGVLVEPGDVEAMKAAFDEALSRPPPMLDDFLEEHSPQHVASRYTELLLGH